MYCIHFSRVRALYCQKMWTLYGEADTGPGYTSLGRLLQRTTGKQRQNKIKIKWTCCLNRINVILSCSHLFSDGGQPWLVWSWWCVWNAKAAKICARKHTIVLLILSTYYGTECDVGRPNLKHTKRIISTVLLTESTEVFEGLLL